MTKICRVCFLEKPLTEFTVRKDRAVHVWTRHQAYCKSCGREISRQWKIEHPDRTRQLSRESAARFFELNPERVRENSRRSVKTRLKTDIRFRILQNLRRRLHKAVVGESYSESTKGLLGCSLEQLKLQLSSQFQPGMSWENYGRWHIDHVRPCASFDLARPDERAKCFHHTNLQPLWAIDNLKKSDHNF